jgi:glycosyltransferase involved in cell wall biosynthesis
MMELLALDSIAGDDNLVRATGRPSVSVIIAAYNEAEHIARCIRSLATQTAQPVEILLVNDGSTDDTAQIARSIGVDGVTVIDVEHRGPARARNIGAAQASGEILAFVDGDMSCGPEFIERLTAPIAAGAAPGTFTRDLFVGNPENRWARAYCSIRRLSYPRLLPSDFPDRWANYRAIRRERFLAVGGYDDVGYGEDMTLAPKLGQLALVAPGALAWHFNPSTLREIFENGRWIGRGHDIGHVAHPWRENLSPGILVRSIRGVMAGHGFAVIPARAAYHAGVLAGLCHRLHCPRQHWK